MNVYFSGIVIVVLIRLLKLCLVSLADPFFVLGLWKGGGGCRAGFWVFDCLIFKQMCFKFHQNLHVYTFYSWVCGSIVEPYEPALVPPLISPSMSLVTYIQ